MEDQHHCEAAMLIVKAAIRGVRHRLNVVQAEV